MEKQQVNMLGPVCNCKECGNYDPNFENHCDILLIAFDDPGKCFAKMTRAERMKQERRIAADLGRVPDIAKAKIKYWDEHPLKAD